MSNHPVPPPLPSKLTKKQSYRGSLFTSSIAVFVTAAPVLYILIQQAGVALPHYYPSLRTVSYTVLPSLPVIDLYGRLVYSLGGAFTIMLIHFLLRPFFSHVHLIRLGYLTAFAMISLWFAIALLIVETGRTWLVEQGGLATQVPINGAFYLAVTGVLVFFIGVLVSALAVRRVAHLGKITQIALKNGHVG
ncbi:MAG: hypothetical protein U0517_01130 [Candidatus Andersenbacteria bacterium]